MLHADAPGRSVSTHSVEDLLSGNRDLTVGSIHRQSVDTRSTETVTHTANCGNTEEITQVQSFDKVDMAFAVRDQSRQRRTLLMFRGVLFLDRVNDRCCNVEDPHQTPSATRVWSEAYWTGDTSDLCNRCCSGSGNPLC